MKYYGSMMMKKEKHFKMERVSWRFRCARKKKETATKDKMQCFMQRPVHPSYGRAKQNMDRVYLPGRVWTGTFKKKFLCIMVSRT